MEFHFNCDPETNLAPEMDAAETISMADQPNEGIYTEVMRVDTADVNMWCQTRERQLTAKAAKREAEKAAKKAEKEAKKAEKEGRKAEREVIRVEKEARKVEREAETARKEVEKDAENKRNINGKAAQSNGNKRIIPIVKKTKRGKKGKVDLGTCEAILDTYHTQQNTTATSNNNGNIPNNSITEGQEEGGKDIRIQKAGVMADKDTAGKSKPHYLNV